MNARVMWDQASPDGVRDACVIEWDYRHSHEVPVDALNIAMAAFYNEDLHPFFYLTWNADGTPAGLLLTESMDLEDSEIAAIYDRVVELAETTPQGGEWGEKDVPV